MDVKTGSRKRSSWITKLYVGFIQIRTTEEDAEQPVLAEWERLGG